MSKAMLAFPLYLASVNLTLNIKLSLSKCTALPLSDMFSVTMKDYCARGQGQQ